MLSESLVSVVFPAYNHEKYVQETINSIINQSYENIELLIIDDGSTDSTWLKILEMEEVCKKRFKRVVFKTQKNQGTCVTLNNLIDLIEGKYFLPMASDDMLKPNAVEFLYEFLSNNEDYVHVGGNDDIIDGDSRLIAWDENQNVIEYNNPNSIKDFGTYLQNYRKDVDFYSDDFGEYSSFVRGNYVPNGYLRRTEDIKRVGCYKLEAPLEDWYMNLQFAKLGKFKYFDEIVYSYRWHKNNSITNKDKMFQFALKTINYEKRLLANLEDKRWQKLFYDNIDKNMLELDYISKIKIHIKYLGYKYLLRNTEKSEKYHNLIKNNYNNITQ